MCLNLQLYFLPESPPTGQNRIVHSESLSLATVGPGPKIIDLARSAPKGGERDDFSLLLVLDSRYTYYLQYYRLGGRPERGEGKLTFLCTEIRGFDNARERARAHVSKAGQS